MLAGCKIDATTERPTVAASSCRPEIIPIMKMKLSSPPTAIVIAATLLVLGIVSSRADVADKISKSFDVAPGGSLVVEVDRGDIAIQSAAQDSVQIEVTREAGGSQSKAETILKDHLVSTTLTGNKVEVRAEYTGPKKSGWFGSAPKLQVSYVITVPRTFDVELKTAGGNIKVVELTGSVKVNTSGGNLSFEKIVGPVSGRTSGGHINLSGAKGNVELRTSGGHLALSDIEGDLSARTSGGHVKVSNVTGKVDLKTSGGNIGLAALSGSVTAATSGGHVTAEFPTQPGGDCSLSTSGGNITIGLGETVAVDVDLSTGGGRTSTEIPVATMVEGEPKRGKLEGKINGGGPLIKGRTSGGNIQIQKK